MRGGLYIKLDGSLHIVLFISLFQDSAAPLCKFKQSLMWFSELDFSLVPDVETWIIVPPFLGRFTDVWVCLKIGYLKISYFITKTPCVDKMKRGLNMA